MRYNHFLNYGSTSALYTKAIEVFFSFLTRLFSSPPQQLPSSESEENTELKIIVIKEGGKFFHNFQLFHRATLTSIDTLIFLPHLGILLGETVSWNLTELENATVERASRQIKRPPSTRFEATESKIRQKLADVLSFDFTPIYRFIWMKNLTEDEFDTLDLSFHELLPKKYLLFKDESGDSLKQKLYAMGPYRDEPLSSLKIIGALNSYTYILPTSQNPAGAILSPEQTHFLSVPLELQMSLTGGYGSGKSTLLLRKAMLILLTDKEASVLFIAPTLLASELLRNEFVSLLYYGALEIDLLRITFIPPQDDITEHKCFQEATVVMCDDAYLLGDALIDRIKHHQGNRSLLLSTVNPDTLSEYSVGLLHRYRSHIDPRIVTSTSQNTLHLLLSDIRHRLTTSRGQEIMIVFADADYIDIYKDSIDEYLGSNCRIVTPSFSLQYQNLDDIVLTTPDSIGGLSIPHLFFIVEEKFDDYTYILSRASESSTIITYPNPQGEADAKNLQE